MDDRARAIFDEARATLARIANVKVEYRSHRDDGYSSEWAKGMPPKPAPPTIEEVRREIAEALAAQPHAPTAEETKRLIESALASHDEVWREVHGRVIAQERKLWRAEIAKAAPKQGNEFFYLDEHGNKRDAELHRAIIAPVDHPIDETIMGPIRSRHRARFVAEREARRQRRG